MVTVKRVVTLKDCRELSSRLRSEDRKEVRAFQPNIPLAEALHDCVQMSYKTYAVMEEGVGCIAIFGMRKCEPPTGKPFGVPWLLCSDELFKSGCKKFIKESKEYLKEVTEDFYYYFNYVAATNLKAHRWLSWMGFHINKEVTRTVNGVSFYPFIYLRNDNV